MTITLNGTTGITAPGLETFGDGTALGGATNPIVSMAKGANNYVQSYIINNTNGTSASADFVAYPSNGADTHGWVDMGITSLSYADSTYTVTGPNESYLFASAPSGSSTTGNLVIATDNTGTANSIQFYTNGFTQAKSAAKMVIDGATGNVGIGTSSPSSKLTVNGASGALNFNLANVGGYGTLATFGVVNIGTDNSSYIGSVSNNPFLFYTNNAERARIDPNGNLLVGTTSSGGVNANCINLEPANQRVLVQHASGTGSGTTYIAFTYNAGSVGSITQNGTTGVLYNLTSDYRLKNDPQPLTGAKEFVMALQPKKWQWWDGSGEGVGFIAHEFMEVAKYSGHGEKDAVDEEGKIIAQSIQPSSSEVMANLVSFIQEQQAIIEQLRADVEALKA